MSFRPGPGPSAGPPISSLSGRESITAQAEPRRTRLPKPRDAGRRSMGREMDWLGSTMLPPVQGLVWISELP